MNLVLAPFALLLTFILSAQGSVASSIDGQASIGIADKELHAQTPYVNMNIGIEINGLENAAQAAAEALNLIAESLQKISDNPELSAEHQQQIKQSLARVDELSQNLSIVVQQLPATLEKGLIPVVNASDKLASDVKQTIILTAIALILILIVGLIALYHFVLAPGTRSVVKTATLLDELAKTLKTTADIVETASERNLQVMQEVQKMQEQIEER